MIPIGINTYVDTASSIGKNVKIKKEIRYTSKHN